MVLWISGGIGLLALLLILLVRFIATREAWPPLSEPVRLTKGHFRDEQVRFHPTRPRLLAVRMQPPPDKPALDPNAQMTLEVVEIDFSRPDEPTERTIEALAGHSYPSYAGEKGIVALSPKGKLVFLPAGDDTPRPILPPELPERPGKPVASPTGEFVLFLALPPPQAANPTAAPSEAPVPTHEAYLARLPRASEITRVGHRVSSDARLTSADFASNRVIFLTYQIGSGASGAMRIDSWDLAAGEQRLAVYATTPRVIQALWPMLLFAQPSLTGMGAEFFTRSQDRTAVVSISDQEIRALWLQPSGLAAAYSVVTTDTLGANLWVGPIPPEIWAPSPASGGEPAGNP